MALAAISGCGIDVGSAWPQVVGMLLDTNRWLAARASNTLAVIDPEAAKRYGIPEQEP